MISRILKWGNSLAVRIPKAFADELNVAENASIQMMLEEDAIRIAPVREKEWTLGALLAGVRDDNIHEEWETDRPVGKEEW
jgi:antitoxin MazE